jgi:hypothetical protein
VVQALPLQAVHANHWSVLLGSFKLNKMCNRTRAHKT